MAEWICKKCGWKNAGRWSDCAKCNFPKSPSPEQEKEMEDEKNRLKNFLLTTTSNFEIEIFYGIQNANIVLGTGLFSDISATISDLTGSTSSNYQKKLDQATNTVKMQIIKKTISKFPECNAIIGIHVDYSTVNNNMLMVCMYGTAVKIKHDHQHPI